MAGRSTRSLGVKVSIAAFFGLLLYAGIAAAVAAICYRIWRFGSLPEFVAAACTTAVTLAIIYATTGETEAFNLLAVSILFWVAWFSAHAVHVVTKRIRELDA